MLVDYCDDQDAFDKELCDPGSYTDVKSSNMNEFRFCIALCYVAQISRSNWFFLLLAPAVCIK